MEKISVGVLGATGMVGQKFIEKLCCHPWFKLTALAASERSAGKKFKDAVEWRMGSPLNPETADMVLHPCAPDLPCDIVFSGLDSSVAGEIEFSFAQAGYKVISNARNHRMDPTVPLLIPEINSAHLKLIESQSFSGGAIITNPNCSVAGLCMALKPLIENWGVEKVHVVTLQALSGAGYPGVASLDIIDNVIPFISGEEDKVETEPLKIFGGLEGGRISPYPMHISAQCTRVPVSDGHMACVSVKLKHSADAKEIIRAWTNFSGAPQELKLPSAPVQPLIYCDKDSHPQPRLHRNLGEGMSVAIGRLRKCPLLDWKFVLLSHNTVRGAAGSALLNAELFVSALSCARK